MTNTKFIPALRFRWLTPMYDKLISFTMPEKKIRESVVSSAAISTGTKLLDFGCGTATLTIMAKQISPEAIISGIDIDTDILKKAIKKIEAQNLDILLVNYNGKQLPFNSNEFDSVISCLVFHHLETDTKQNALANIFRVLNKSGKLCIADFGYSDSLLQRLLFNIIRSLDGFKSTSANAKGLLPHLIAEAGFENVSIIKRFKTIFGEVQIITANKI